MKHRTVSLVGIITVCMQATAEQQCATHPALGKTHFIVDAENHPVATTACIATSASTPSQKMFPAASALFSPTNDVRTQLIELIEQEAKIIRVAIYLLSDRDIAHALIGAHRRGVSVEVLTDPTCLRTRGNKIDELKAAGIPVHVYKGCKDTPGCMHNKFVIFGNNEQQTVWTGSFNFTPSAAQHNYENVVIIRDTSVAKQFGDQFEKIKKESHALQTSEIKIARCKPGCSRTPKHKEKVLHHYDSFLVRS